MAFVISNKSSYTWPVKYESPGNDGRYEKSEFLAEFKRLPQSKLDELHEAAKSGTLKDEDVLSDVLLGWSGIKTSTGDSFEYNEANRVVLLELPGMRSAIINAFTGSITGAARKN